MATKLKAAHIATSAGADMVIANGNDFHVIHKLCREEIMNFILADKKEEFIWMTLLINWDRMK